MPKGELVTLRCMKVADLFMELASEDGLVKSVSCEPGESLVTVTFHVGVIVTLKPISVSTP